MADVVLLTLGDGPSGCDCTGGCGVDHAVKATPRVPVLACADELRRAGRRVDLVTAGEDAEIDAAVKPVTEGDARLVVAAATDGELRAVLRRLMRRYAPSAAQRPPDLPAGRTLDDLPPIGVLPLAPATPELVSQLDLPRTPAAVAAAVVAGRSRRLDLLRNDGGSLTLHAARIGATDANGQPTTWHGLVEVDDTVLSDGTDALLAAGVANAGPVRVSGLPLVTTARGDDGMLEAAVAVPILKRRLLRPASVTIEVRRAGGRAVSVTPRAPEVGLVDDGVHATLNRKRTWWVEPGAWAVYIS